MALSKYTFKKSYIGRKCSYDQPVTIYGWDTGKRSFGTGKIVDFTTMPSDWGGGLFCLVIEINPKERVIVDAQYVTLNKRFIFF